MATIPVSWGKPETEATLWRDQEVLVALESWDLPWSLSSQVPALPLVLWVTLVSLMYPRFYYLFQNLGEGPSLNTTVWSWTPARSPAPRPWSSPHCQVSRIVPTEGGHSTVLERALEPNRLRSTPKPTADPCVGTAI